MIRNALLCIVAGMGHDSGGAAGPRDRILVAASSATRELGVDGLTLEEVAGRAGVARPNLYRYFSGKDALVREVLLREVRAIHGRRALQLAAVTDSRQRIVESLVAGAELTRAGEVVPAVAGPGLDGVARLVVHDPDLLELELDYWGPLLTAGREARVVVEHLDDERIVRWFMTCQYLAAVQPELVGDDVRRWVTDFVVPAVLVATGRVPDPR